MSGPEVALAIFLGIVAAPAVVIIIACIVVFVQNCWVWLTDRGSVAVCRCGAEFGHKPYQVFKYSVDSIPVYKDYKGSLDRVTFIRAAWHRRFNCDYAKADHQDRTGEEICE